MAAHHEHELTGTERRPASPEPASHRPRWRQAAARPVDAASVAVFRIAFGVLIVVDVFLYVPVLAREYYMESSFHFGYGPLAILGPPPGQGVRLVYLAMAVAGALVALGWHTRLAAAGVALANTYIFLLDASFFQNHIYLISLVAVLLVVLPTDRRWSLDARRRARTGIPGPTTVPAGVVWMLRFQIGVPYVYGGLAKLNADWLAGEPLRMWLAARTDVEPLHTVLTTEAVVMFMAYGALVFDLAVVPLLLVRRTRAAAFVVAVCFHVTNAWLFGLYVFPWLMIAATTIFFPPGWPWALVRRFQARWPALASATVSEGRPAPVGLDGATGGGGGLGGHGVIDEDGGGLNGGVQSGGGGVVTGIGGDVGGDAPWGVGGVTGALGRRTRPVPVRVVAVVAGVWIAVQLLVPLRHFLIPGDPSWTEQAHRFAWHMRLREKAATVTFVVDDGERVVRVDPGGQLGAKQSARLGGHPERLVQFARHLSELHGGAVVRAETSVSLNGRDPQPIVDPTVDLASVSYASHGPNEWILPLEQPRRRSSDRPG